MNREYIDILSLITVFRGKFQLEDTIFKCFTKTYFKKKRRKIFEFR